MREQRCFGSIVDVLRPGFLSPSAGLKFADIPNGLAAVSKVPVAGWAQIAAYFGFVEFSGGFDDYKSGTPGDYGFKVLTSSDPAEKTKKLSAELANGRLAMMAIIGMFFQASENLHELFTDCCTPVFCNQTPGTNRQLDRVHNVFFCC